MKYSEAKRGRMFVIRLEDGDILHEEIERFAVAQGIRAASLIALGGADAGSKLVVGPALGRSMPIEPLELDLDNVYEVAGTGTIFPNAEGRPELHMHLACGRGSDAVLGCVRRGVKVWHVIEVVLTELTDTSAVRALDAETGFYLLRP
ncbi:MAG TPA: DUF296 domain-containing protein [Verrucomicrobia bacterium]|nr:MAG: DNA-binding protein [Lentisphaerae bacterium GWF2_57_35]HBA86196.1 DUF296 domain-containing protein [Verrucomicrobiota bacterium]